ncbi:MAG TPA: ABC transporter permease [Chlamydiales bacterium]
MKRKSLNLLEMVGEYIFFLADVGYAALRRPSSWQLIREQLYHLGVMSFSVVAITGFTTGFVLAAQSFYQLGEKGLAGVTGVLVAKSMITELGPILTALMVTGRVGASMCAELGTMKVTEQIDALKSMAVDPNAYLVAPRFIAGFVMIPLLTMFSIAMGIFGGYLIAASYFHMPTTTFLEPMKVHISSFDILTGVIKAFVFGVLLVTVCCFKGMKTSGGAAGVGRSTTQSVVTSYVLILLSDFFLTMLLNMIHMKVLHL